MEEGENLINTIVFDVDGTLYDETHAKIKAELLTAKFISDKSNVSMEMVHKIFQESKDKVTNDFEGLPERNDRRKWYKETLQRINAINVTEIEACEYYWNVVFDNIEPYIDLISVLPELSQKYKLFVLTDEFLEIQKIKLNRLGLDSYFIEVISSDQIGENKPSRTLFNYILNIIGESPSNVIMVGDNPPADIKGGNIAGMHTAWLKRGKYSYYSHNDDEKPDIIIHNYLEFDNQIRNL